MFPFFLSDSVLERESDWLTEARADAAAAAALAAQMRVQQGGGAERQLLPCLWVQVFADSAAKHSV